MGVRGIATVGDRLGASAAREVVDVESAVVGGVGAGVGSGMGPNVWPRPFSPCLQRRSLHTTNELRSQPFGLLQLN